MARIYEAKTIDLEIAPCSAYQDPTGGVGVISKSKVLDQLNKILDAKTVASIPQSFRPLALRWRVAPSLGLPQTPFQVYRRNKNTAYAEKSVPVFTAGPLSIFTAGPYWTITFGLANTTAFPVTATLSPIDQKMEAIPGAAFTRTIAPVSTQVVKLSYPNINGLILLSGSISILNLTGSTMNDIVNDPAWELIEVVGLPLKTAAAKAPVYANQPQGYPSNLKDGDAAAADRVDIARLFYTEPAYTQPDATVLPAWKTPTGAQLVGSLQATSSDKNGNTTGILYDIVEMLSKVHQNPQLYTGEQINFKKKTAASSFSDGTSPSTETAGFENPVCNTTLLGGAIDCWNALGIGLGTTDFAALGGNQKYDEAGNTLNLLYDYMVSAQFLVPEKAVDNIYEYPPKMKFVQYKTLEFAALSHAAPQIGPVGALKIDNYTENRPAAIDKPYSKESKIYWNKPASLFPVSYAIAVKDALTGQLGYLNKNRAFLSAYPLPFFPAERADAAAVNGPGGDSDQYVRYYHHKNPVPFTGTARKDYYIAGQDVFGRWSPFVNGFTNLVPKPPANAEIISARFLIDSSDPSDHIYPAELELVVAWHWDDRRPARINIGGLFVPIPSPPATIQPDLVAEAFGLAMGNATVDNRSYLISFPAFNASNPAASVPVLMKENPLTPVQATEGTVVIDTSGSDGGGTTVKYKIRLKNFVLNFENTSKLAMGLYLRAAENLNPGLFTPFSLPRVITASDPLPWLPPVLLPGVRWGSLPDASNTSRYRVSFSPVPHVAGYAIYRASEADLRYKTGLPPVQPGTDLETRAGELALLPAAGKEKGKDAFIRLNTHMLTDPSIDAVLPGDLEGLYVYACTTFTPVGMESPFSSWIYVGVPHRYTPGSPQLTAFTKRVGNQREIQLKIEVPPGVPTETVEIYRTSKKHLAASPDYMGLPLTFGGLKNMQPNWQAFDGAGVLISPVTPESKVAVYKMTEQVAPSWQPFYYRAVAFGPHDEPKGKFPGRSKWSNPVEIQTAPPDAPPLISGAVLLPLNSMLMKLQFLSDAVVTSTPYGSFQLTVEQRNNATNLFEPIFQKAIPAITKKQAVNIPGLNIFYRADKDAAGWHYEYYPAASDDLTLKITVTDPLGRSSFAVASYKKPPVVLPPVVIKNPVVKKLISSVEISFACSVGPKPAVKGSYTLEILASPKGALQPRQPLTRYQVLLSQTMDTIGTAIPPGNTGVYRESSPNLEKLFVYHAFFKDPATIKLIGGADLSIRVTDPDGGTVLLNIP
ncbi:MAG: hypothetical protein INR73_01555 [Williamsia sp.]|nr:hypothetical protein [Williamsia sp.]